MEPLFDTCARVLLQTCPQLHTEIPTEVAARIMLVATEQGLINDDNLPWIASLPVTKVDLRSFSSIKQPNVSLLTRDRNLQ